MSGFINIGGDPNDRSYRYKMPRLVAKVEGRGNGIKTRIVNCADIASAIHRKPAVVTKFFGCEMGAQSRWEEKEEASIVNGAFEGKILEEKLMGSFIPKFVLCPNCGLPETDMKVKKEVVKFECAACGYTGNADMSHKLCTFIIADDKKDREKKKKEDKGKDKDKKSGAADEGGAEGDKDDKKHSEKGEKKHSKDKEKSKDKHKSKDKSKSKEKKKEESDEEEWFTDISAEAVEARRLAEMESMSSEAAKMITGAEAGDAKPPAAEEEAPADKADEDSSEGDDSGEFLSSLLEAIGELKKSKEVNAVVGSWAEGLESPPKKALFSMMESLPESVVKHATIILKALYDNDVLTDDDIFAWHDDCDEDSAVATTCQAFVDFLRD